MSKKEEKRATVRLTKRELNAIIGALNASYISAMDMAGRVSGILMPNTAKAMADDCDVLGTLHGRLKKVVSEFDMPR